MSQRAPGQNVVAICADALYQAESSRVPIAPLTKTFPGLSVADAYRVQQFNVERRVGAGQRVVGHKIGLTSKAMQEQFHVNEPDYGHLLDAMVLDGGKPLDLDPLIDPRIEVEPAFVLGRGLKGPGVTPDDVLRAAEYVTLCFEIIDSRINDWRVKLQDTVADNGSSARLVMGSHRIRPSRLRLDELDTELALDGAVVERGSTREILGHPAKSVAWLTNHMAEYGVALEPGHIVLPGTCMRSWRIWGRRRLGGRIAGLGDIELDVTGTPAITNATN